MRSGSDAAATPFSGGDDLAIVLTGGGARAAYQAGVLRGIARHLPELRFPVIAGVSAGAINCAFLAAQRGGLHEAAENLVGMWSRLREEEVFRPVPLTGTLANWGSRLFSSPSNEPPDIDEVRGLVDTRPLRELLRRTVPHVDGEIAGIADNIERGLLRAVALTTHSYTTGQGVTWVQGSDPAAFDRAGRIAVKTRLSVEHVMASSAVPLIFPAIRLGNEWHGDGGLGQNTPLAPAIHFGARRILTISTRHVAEKGAAPPTIEGYPQTAQVIGAMLEMLFSDTVEQDTQRLDRITELLHRLPREQWGDLEPVDLLVLRPSQDLAALAQELQPTLPRTLRFLVRGLGSSESKSPDFLSVLLFHPEYAARLIALGEADAERQWPQLEQLLCPPTARAATAG